MTVLQMEHVPAYAPSKTLTSMATLFRPIDLAMDIGFESTIPSQERFTVKIFILMLDVSRYSELKGSVAFSFCLNMYPK